MYAGVTIMFACGQMFLNMTWVILNTNFSLKVTKTMIQVEINWQPNQQVSICGSRHRHHLMFNLFNGIFWRFAHYSNTKFWTSLYSIQVCVWGCFACFRVYPYYCCRFQLEKIDFHLWLCAFFVGTRLLFVWPRFVADNGMLF